MQSIILLHGALGSARSMLPLSRELETVADVHILDFSGHGEASWPEEGFAMELFAQDVLRLMDDRGLASAHIFGYSMGGFVGMRLAQTHPNRISSVTTLATKFDWTEATCSREAQGLDPDALEAKVPKFSAGLAKLHTRAGWRKVMEATRSMLEGMHRYRFDPEALGEIGTPLRLIVGDRDRMVSLEETIAVFRSLPKAELCVLPGTPHPLEAVNLELLASQIRPMLLPN